MLIKKLSVYAISTFIEKALIFFLPAIFTFYLNPDELGIVANFGISVSVVTILITIGTNISVTIEFYKKAKNDFFIYLSSGLFNMCLSTLVLFVILFFTKEFIYDYVLIPTNWILVIPVIGLFTGISSVLLSIYQVELKAFFFGFFSIVKSLLYLLISSFLLFFFNFGLTAIFWGLLASTAVVGFSLIFVFSLKKQILFVLDKKNSKEIFLLGIPMIPHLLGFTVINYSDRIFLTKMISLEELGVYHIGYTIGMSLSLVIVVFNKAWLPFFFEYLKKGDIGSLLSIRRVSYYFVLTIFAMACVVVLITPYIYTYLIDVSYWSGSKYVIWITFSFFLSSIYFIFSNFLLYFKRLKEIMYITVACTIFNLLLNYFLILKFGGIGAAYSTFLTFFIMSSLISYVALKVIPKSRVMLGFSNSFMD